MIVFFELDERPDEPELSLELSRLAALDEVVAAAATVVEPLEVDLAVDVNVTLPLVLVITVVTTATVGETDDDESVVTVVVGEVSDAFVVEGEVVSLLMTDDVVVGCWVVEVGVVVEDVVGGVVVEVVVGVLVVVGVDVVCWVVVEVELVEVGDVVVSEVVLDVVELELVVGLFLLVVEEITSPVPKICLFPILPSTLVEMDKTSNASNNKNERLEDDFILYSPYAGWIRFWPGL